MQAFIRFFSCVDLQVSYMSIFIKGFLKIKNNELRTKNKKIEVPSHKIHI